MNDGDDAAASSTRKAADMRWNEQDRRTLIITIVGTLAANLATVLMVGGALAYVHASKRIHTFDDLLWSVLVPGLVLGPISIAFGYVIRRGHWRSRGLREAEVPFGWQFWVGLGCLMLLFGLLILMGLAAGVK